MQVAEGSFSHVALIAAFAPSIPDVQEDLHSSRQLLRAGLDRRAMF